MNKTPPLRAIQAFEAFGRRGSMTAAATELGVSVGAVSQQIRKAEEALEARLLERRGRSVALTALGRVYHAAVSLGFDQIRAAHDIIDRAQSANTLTISCLPSLASKWIGPQLLDWQIAHPGATVRLVGAETEPRLD
ncbi:MAG: LysR family transcriptional regulator, partial [Mesorhizobium sp.]